MTPHRSVAPWDDYFLALAVAASTRSKDPSTQHGALVVDRHHIVLGTGYNGGPRGIDDRDIDWSRPAKYPFVIHAELNALWQAARRLPDLAGCTLYVTGPPCSRCLLLTVHAGIRRVVHGETPSVCVDEEDRALSQRIAALAGCELCRHEAGRAVP